MAKTSLSDAGGEHTLPPMHPWQPVGPFITISREYGCQGFSLALLLWDILNEHATRGQAWQVYHKDILSRLATETHLAEDLLQREMVAKRSLIVDFFSFFSHDRIPSGYEIRNRITTIIRGLAIHGHAIILGQGSAAATGDLPNGISVRLEAPEDWRVRRIVFGEGIDEVQAREKMQHVEEQRQHMRSLYESRFPRKPAFNLVFDCSMFSLAQIAQTVIYLMKLRGLL